MHVHRYLTCVVGVQGLVLVLVGGGGQGNDLCASFFFVSKPLELLSLSIQFLTMATSEAMLWNRIPLSYDLDITIPFAPVVNPEDIQCCSHFLADAQNPREPVPFECNSFNS